MVGLFNFNPSLVAEGGRQGGLGGFDPMMAGMGLMAMGQAFGRRPRYTTSISEATAPDDSGMRTAIGLMNYQRQAQRDRLAERREARQAQVDEMQIGKLKREADAESELGAVASDWARRAYGTPTSTMTNAAGIPTLPDAPDARPSMTQAGAQPGTARDLARDPAWLSVMARRYPTQFATMANKQRTLTSVAPGASLYDQDSGQTVFTAPAKPENEPEHLRLMRAAGIDPSSPQGKQMLTTYLNSKGDKPTNELYYDPNSPTGTRYARSNLPGPPQSGIDVEMTPDGKVARLRQGAQMPGAAGGGALEKSVRGDNQKQLLSLGERMLQLSQIEAQFQPQFHQWGTRLGAGVKDLRDKTGLDALKLSPQEAQGLGELRNYQATVGNTMSEIRHEMFGSALTKTESSKADEYIINSDDSPTTAQAKLRSFKELTTKAMARRKYADANGLDWNSVPLDKMPSIIRERGDYLAKLVKMKNQDADEIAVRDAVNRQLAIEFGFAQ